MRDIVNKTFAQIVRDKKRHKRIVALICALSVLVATGVFNELMQPVITMTPEPICGITAHDHDSNCYKQQLVCGLEAGEDHQHSDDCYQSVFACGMAQHTHTDSCYPDEIAEEAVVLNNDEKATPVEIESQSETDAENDAEPTVTEAPAEETDSAEIETSVGNEVPEETAAPETTEEPSAEETEPSAPTLSSLTASAESVTVGQNVSWSFTAQGASELTYSIADAEGNKIVENSIETDSGLVSWLADREGEFTLKLVASNENGAVSESASVTVLATEKMTVGVSSGSNYVFPGNSIAFNFVCDGAEPVNVHIAIDQDGTELYSSDTFTDSVQVTTLEMGKKVTEITAAITATDALGETASDSITILCPVSDSESESKWRRSASVTLGEDWCENLVAVAKTQLGYKESDLDFIVDSEGVKHGYTRYGHWYGARYSEWCAMFASFCLNYAQIPESYFPQDSNCANWVSELKYRDLYQSAMDYQPAVGDLVFFDWENDGRADHVGIVIAVNGSEITTIEGNVGNGVGERSYNLAGENDILGFGCLSAAYEKYLADHADEEPVVEDQTEVAYQANLMLDAPVYAEADADSEIIVYLTMGTVVDVLSEEQNSVGSFCKVSVDDVIGYISAEYFESNIDEANSDDYDTLMSALEEIAMSEYTADEIDAFVVRCDAAYECGNLTDDEYVDLVATAQALLGDGAMTLADTDSTEITKATRKANSNGKYGIELSVKFIPVDDNGNELSNVVAPNNTRYYFDYSDWSSEKTVADHCSAITSVITSGEVYDVDLINMNTGLKAYDATYAKINASGYLFTGSTYAAKKAVTGDYSTQYVYLAVYYQPAEFTLTFTDGNGNTLASTTALRGGSATIPSIDNYALNTQNEAGQYLTGWKSAGSTVYSTAIYNVQSNMTLTPNWSDEALGEYTVTFSYGESKTESVTAYDGQKFGELSAPVAEKEGYRFDGWFDENDVEYTAATVITGAVTLTAKYTKYITVSFNINNSDYTNDPGSGYTHVTVASTEGLSTNGYTYTQVGTGDRYRVSGTGTIYTVTIPSGESLSDNGLTLFKVNVENQVENGGTSNNTYTYVSTYSWINSDSMVCTANTVFTENTNLYLRLYAQNEYYYLNFVCCESCANSVYGVLSNNGVTYPNATFGVDESVSSEYILSAADVNAYYNCNTCTACGRNNGKVLDHWYILDQSGNQVTFNERTTMIDSYLPTSGNTVTVYAAWKDAPSTISVTFYKADGYTTISSNAEAANYSTLADLKPTDPSLEGCNFLGWKYKDGNGAILADSTIISADSEFVAVFSVPVTLRMPDLANDALDTYTKTTFTVRSDKFLSDAVDTAGNTISVPSFVNGYFFADNYTCSYTGGNETVSNLAGYGWYPSALTLTPNYTKGVKLTFRYSIEDGETVTVATYYIKDKNGSTYDMVDSEGNACSSAPTLSVPGYTFNEWLDEDGKSFLQANYTNYSADTVFTASLTKLTVVEFVEQDFADADNDNDTTEYITTHTYYVASDGMLSDAVDADGNALSALPTGANGLGMLFAGWKIGEADATLRTVISEDTTITAQYTTAPIVTFNHLGTTYKYTVESGTTFAVALETAKNDTENPLPLDEIMANQSVTVDDETVSQSFKDWSYNVAVDGEAVLTPVSDDFKITENIEFIATYNDLAYVSVILHDVNPDGKDYEGITVDISLPVGESVKDYLAEPTLHGDVSAADVIWHTEDGATFDIDSAITANTELYTYTYRLVLALNSASAAAEASMLDALIPSAQAASVTVADGFICIDVREGEKLKASDFVINGVDYSMYTVTINGSEVLLSSYIGKSLTENVVATNPTLANVTTYTKTVNFYVFLDGERKLVASKEMQLYLNSSKRCLTAGQLESIYAEYGLSASDIEVGKYSAFAQTNEGNSSIWLDANVTQTDSETVMVPTLQQGDDRNVDIYYLPKTAGTYISQKAYTSYLTSDTFYTVKVLDPANIIYESADDIPAVKYVLTGNTATVTVKKGTWELSVEPTSTTANDDGTTTYTFANVTTPITLTAKLPVGTYLINYDINATVDDNDKFSDLPTISGGSTYADSYHSDVDEDGNYTGQFTEDYLVLTPSSLSYLVKWYNRDNYFAALYEYKFDGWVVYDGEGSKVADSDGNEIILQNGSSLTAEYIADLDTDSDNTVYLKAKWTELTINNTVNFYINLGLQVENYDGKLGSVAQSNFTESLYATALTVEEPIESYTQKVVITGKDQMATADTDKEIRKLLNGYTTSNYDNVERTFTVDSIPSDEYFLATVRDKQIAYVKAFYESSYTTVKDYINAGNKIIYEVDADGNYQYIEPNSITSANYTVRWYVFKWEDTTTGWHIDGILVKKQGQLTVTKNFYGDVTAIAAVKNSPYTITVSNGTEVIYTLNLTEKSDTNTNGYTAYDETTDTYTWVIPLTQGATYTLTENNYPYTNTDTEDIATIAEYMVTNSNVTTENKGRTTYTGPVSVVARAYESDLGYSNYKTVSFYNSYIPKNTTLITKVDDNGQALSGVKFKLLKNGEAVQLYRGDSGKYYVYTPAAEVETAYTQVDYITTDSDGHVLVVGLEDEGYYGKYSLIEVEAPEGYKAITEEITFDVDANGIADFTHTNAECVNNHAIRITNYSDGMDVKVVKQWAEGDTNANTEVKVTLCLNGTPISSYETALNAENNWMHTWEGVPAYFGGAPANYTVRETWIGRQAFSAVYTDGYADYNVSYSKPSSTTDEEGKTTAAFTVYNSTSTGNVYFSKVDEDSKPLSGATFATYALYKDGKLTTKISEASSAASGQVSFGSLAVGTYYMKETAAPNGYQTDSNVYKVVVTENDTTITLISDDDNESGSDIKSITNYPSSKEITIKKVDGNGNPLSGATFQIKKDGTPYLYDGTNSNITGAGTANGQKISVQSGSYTIAETTAPAGYYGMTGSISFTVENGTVAVDTTNLPNGVTWDADSNTFTVKNVPGTELPSTGGMGTTQYTIGGLLLMAASLVIGIGLRRKRERMGG